MQSVCERQRKRDHNSHILQHNSRQALRLTTTHLPLITASAPSLLVFLDLVPRRFFLTNPGLFPFICLWFMSLWAHQLYQGGCCMRILYRSIFSFCPGSQCAIWFQPDIIVLLYVHAVTTDLHTFHFLWVSSSKNQMLFLLWRNWTGSRAPVSVPMATIHINNKLNTSSGGFPRSLELSDYFISKFATRAETSTHYLCLMLKIYSLFSAFW